MYKAVGFFCILAGCAGWGHSLAGQEKERVRHLMMLSQILSRMRSEISYGKHTMPEICLLLAELDDKCYVSTRGRRGRAERISRKYGRRSSGSVWRLCRCGKRREG